jgi:hypothetical protein
VRPEHPLVHKLTVAERRLRRGIVEQSLTLGFAPIADAQEPDDDDDLEPDPGDTFEDEAASVN